MAEESGIQLELERAVQNETVQRKAFYRNIAYTALGAISYPAAKMFSESGADMISSENAASAAILGAGAVLALKGISGLIRYGKGLYQASREVKEKESDKQKYQHDPFHKHSRKRKKNITFMF